MRFLVGHTHYKVSEQTTLNDGLMQIFTDSSNRATYTNDWLSALGYAAIEKYHAIWMEWNLIKKYYVKFHQKLSKINKYVPLIIFSNDSYIDGQLCISNDLLFSVVRLDQIAEKAEDIVARLKLYHKILNDIPDNIRSSIRPNGFGSFIGNSLNMLEMYGQIAKVAGTDFTVLILGESGSGKELVAKSIHEISPRKRNRFVSLNCAAIPENLLESELFGYEKGAFTNAQKTKEGKFELAHQGTLFLDEIGDMSVSLQAKLLRVIEDHAVERLGGTTARQVDFRLLAATNQDLQNLIRDKLFRADLHYRLNVIPIHLTPVTLRKDDVLLLSLYILRNLIPNSSKKIKSISWKLISELENMSFPGNVRELENILIRVIFQSPGSYLSSKTLKEVLKADISYSSVEKDTHISDDDIFPIWEVEKEAIKNAIKRLSGNISQVADRLEISRTALYRKMKKYNLTK